MKLIPHSLSPSNLPGIRSLVPFGKAVASLVNPVLYPRVDFAEVNPKVISERTRYLQV
jgi:hypothetical protein